MKVMELQNVKEKENPDGEQQKERKHAFLACPQ
jgi:hypothetical protein